MTTLVTHKPLAAEARKFKGTIADAEDVKDWASGFEISWAPVDDKFIDTKVDEDGNVTATAHKPNFHKGVTLDVIGPRGYQNADEGDWLIKDQLGIAVYTEEQLLHYFTEVSSDRQ